MLFNISRALSHRQSVLHEMQEIYLLGEMMIDDEELKKRIIIHRNNIANGALKFDSDLTAHGFLLALDDVLTTIDELKDNK